MSAEATVMFGVGATKAGSSWLYRYLLSHPDTYFRKIKELHYFDALDLGGRERVLDRLQTLSAQKLARAEGADGDRFRRQATDIAELRALLSRPGEVPAEYLDYLRDGHDAARLIGDVTPAYALLSEERFVRMAGIAPAVKFVYLLRDPVDRLWSHIRMVAGWSAVRGPRLQAKADAMLDRYIAGEATQLSVRSDYAGTLSRLHAAVAPENLRIEFYERLFRPEAIEGLCRFLGIAPHPGDLKKRVHQGTALKLSHPRREVLREILAPQYDFVREMFRGDLPDRWQDQNMMAEG